MFTAPTSIEPRSQVGAVTSMLRALNQGWSNTRCWPRTEATTMPTRPEPIQLPLPRIGVQRCCHQDLGVSRGISKPPITVTSRPRAKALLTERTNCCRIKLTPQVASRVSRGRP